MSKCHSHEASDRPTFGDILKTLGYEQIEAHEVKVTYGIPPDALND